MALIIPVKGRYTPEKHKRTLFTVILALNLSSGCKHLINFF